MFDKLSDKTASGKERTYSFKLSTIKAYKEAVKDMTEDGVLGYHHMLRNNPKRKVVKDQEIFGLEILNNTGMHEKDFFDTYLWDGERSMETLNEVIRFKKRQDRIFLTHIEKRVMEMKNREAFINSKHKQVDIIKEEELIEVQVDELTEAECLRIMNKSLKSYLETYEWVSSMIDHLKIK